MGKDGGKKAGTVVSRFFEAIGEIFKFFFLLVGKIIAVFFIFIGLVVGGALFVSLFSLVGLPVANYPEFINHIFPSGKYLAFGYIGAVLAIGIPFLMLAWAGARMLFNLKANRVVGFTALGLWLIGVIICLFIGGRVIRSYGVKDSYREEISIAQPKSSVIRIEQEATATSRKTTTVIAAATGVTGKMWTEFDNGDVIEGSFQLTSFEVSGDYNGEQTYSLSLESSGSLTVTAV